MLKNLFKERLKKSKSKLKKDYEMKSKPLHNENPHLKHSKGPKYEAKPERY